MPQGVWCTCCAARWKVQRVIGGDYVLHLVAGENPLTGQDQTLGMWYDYMKAGVRLIPLAEGSLPLAPGEVLYLKSPRVRLVAEAESVLFRGWHDREVPTAPASTINAPPMKRVGWGQLFMTNERLCWSSAGSVYTLWLTKLQRAFVRPFRWLILSYGTNCPYWLCFKGESALKWLMYLDLVAERLAVSSGHRIVLPPY